MKRLLVPALSLFVSLSLFAGPHERDPHRHFDEVAALERLHRGYAFIAGDFASWAEANALADHINAKGGRIDQVINHRILVGSVPRELEESIRRWPGVKLVTRGAVDAANLPSVRSDAASLGASKFFNAIVDGSVYRDAAAPDAAPERLPNDGHVSARPAFLPATAAHGGEPTTLATNNAMIGRIGVVVHFVESNGAIDPNYYTWLLSDRGTITDRVLEGTRWWQSRAFERGISILYNISFQDTRDFPQVAQSYEPILHAGTERYLWMNEIMANYGFTQWHSNPEQRAILRNDAYNEWFRSLIGGNGAFSLYVCYNPSPAATAWTDGSFARAWLGGPAVNQLFRPSTYNPTQTGWGRLFAHEMGHMFWACDEYGLCSGCNNCPEALVGPRPSVLNGNCENSCPTATHNCIMRATNSSVIVCPFTEDQIGWP